MSFLGLGEKNYASIVGPLKKMANDLTAYIAEQREKISTLQIEQAEIGAKITASTNEITKSEFTTGKIGELIATDLDDNGIADIDEVPDEETPEPPVDEEPPVV